MALFDYRTSALLYKVIGVICQTLVYGSYLCLFPIAVYVLLSRGLYNRSRMVLFVAMVIMFALSTIYWASSVTVTFLIFRAWFSELDPATQSPPNWLPMLSAILLVNLIVTDGVVVWRAWIVCSDMNKAILMTPVVILAIDTLIYVTTVVVRAGLLITPKGTKIHQDLSRTIKVTQVSNVALSLLTNVLATSIIATKTWKYRKSLLSYNVEGQTSTLASRVLSLLVESGMLYILIGVLALASSVIRMPFGTLGDLLGPVGVQLAGIYPIIVLLVVDRTNSLKSTSYHSSGSVIHGIEDQSPHLEPLTFATGPDTHQSSGIGLEDSETKLPHTSTRISFDVELNAGNSTDRRTTS